MMTNNRIRNLIIFLLFLKIQKHDHRIVMLFEFLVGFHGYFGVEVFLLLILFSQPILRLLIIQKWLFSNDRVNSCLLCFSSVFFDFGFGQILQHLILHSIPLKPFLYRFKHFNFFLHLVNKLIRIHSQKSEKAFKHQYFDNQRDQFHFNPNNSDCRWSDEFSGEKEEEH